MVKSLKDIKEKVNFKIKETTINSMVRYLKTNNVSLWG